LQQNSVITHIYLTRSPAVTETADHTASQQII